MDYQSIINIAHINPSTRALGPGLRAAVWVKGCPFRCQECLAPEWIPTEPARLMTPQQVVDELLANADVQGLTFSGGEPMFQAAGLVEVALLAKSRRDVNIICFTGYKYQNLIKNHQKEGVLELMNTIDVLIDGSYLPHLNSGIGLRGSDNQQIIHMTDRLIQSHLETLPRQVEIEFRGDHVILAGIPNPEITSIFRNLVPAVRS